MLLDLVPPEASDATRDTIIWLLFSLMVLPLPMLVLTPAAVVTFSTLPPSSFAWLMHQLPEASEFGVALVVCLEFFMLPEASSPWYPSPTELFSSRHPRG